MTTILSFYGVNVNDTGLKQLLLQSDTTTRINALASLKEATIQNRVKNPNAFLKFALRENWKPKNNKYCLEVARELSQSAYQAA